MTLSLLTTSYIKAPSLALLWLWTAALICCSGLDGTRRGPLTAREGDKLGKLCNDLDISFLPVIQKHKHWDLTRSQSNTEDCSLCLHSRTYRVQQDVFEEVFHQYSLQHGSLLKDPISV